MKRNIKNLSLILSSVGVILIFFLGSCERDDPELKTYKDDFETLYMFLEDSTAFSSFKQIVDAALIEGTNQSMAGVYKSVNPHNQGAGYTLFLPDNNAMNSYLSNKSTSLEDLLQNPLDCWNIATHHLVYDRIFTREFPDGELDETSLNDAKHSIQYVSTDTGVVYLVDETAKILKNDIEKSNGIIHIIDQVLEPFSYTSCDWLSDNGNYSIFIDALEITGLYDVFQEADMETTQFTMLVEADSIFQKENINSLQDLIDLVSPGNNNYTQPANPLYQYMAFHVLRGNLYVSDMTKTESKDTYGEYPIMLSVESGLSATDNYYSGIGFNKGVSVYDTLISSGNDTTIIDYLSLYKGPSNKATLSGALHFINNVMVVNTVLTAATRYYHFREDPAIMEVFTEQEVGYHRFFENELNLFGFGGDLQYILYYWTDDELAETANNDDFIMVEGLYEISYTTNTKITPGRYSLGFQINAVSSTGFIDVYLDDTQKVGGTINLSTINPPNTVTSYKMHEIGEVTLQGYTTHKITVKAATPGVLIWDMIRFSPVAD